jgi:hypothetical protein
VHDDAIIAFERKAMSVVISFLNDESWFKANWVFRRLREDIKTHNSLSKEDEFKLELA